MSDGSILVYVFVFFRLVVGHRIDVVVKNVRRRRVFETVCVR